MEEFTIVENYLRKDKYLEGLDKGQRAILRRKYNNNFNFSVAFPYHAALGMI